MFSLNLSAIPPRDPNIKPGHRLKAGSQNSIILAALREGPLKNYELARISLKYTSRISDLREAGFTIDEKDGTYTLKEIQG